MISTPTIPAIVEPALLDRALLPIQVALASNLTWLDSVFGKSQKMVKVVDGREQYYPGVYAGDAQYLNALPDSHIGNFCFFDALDNEQIEAFAGGVKMTRTIALILWWDFQKVYPADHEQRTIEHIKEQVLEALRSVSSAQVQLQPIRAYERAENIYQGYTHQESHRQFLMRPYGGLRCDLELTYYENTIC